MSTLRRIRYSTAVGVFTLLTGALLSAAPASHRPLHETEGARVRTPLTGGISTSVVISQVYGGGGNGGSTWKNDYIELFNVSAAPVSLAGWSVQYASSTGSSWQVTSLTGSIGPGQYYLVKEAAGTGGTTNLPTPDATGSISMSASTGKVALVSSTSALSGTCPSANIVDFVGYGSANCFEGTGGTGTLSSTVAALRNDNGCTDSGNNNTDFATGAPNPRNTAAALNPCSGGGGPFITTGSPLPAATIGVAYSLTFTAAGGSGSGYTFLHLSGTLPPGLNFSAGTLSGTPTSVIGSPFSFTIQVTDSASAVSSKAFQLSVIQPNTCEVQGPAPEGCGVERWSVKTGSDPDAALVNLNSATPTSIAALRTFAYPNPSPPANGRVAPAETTQWIIHGTLLKYKQEDDSDYHLVVQDGSGVTMVTEIVYPGESPACVSSSSPFLPGIATTRCEMDGSPLPQATGSFQNTSVPVRIIGAGMFDFPHGQTGAAPNQIEIHPILDIAFLTVANAPTAAGSDVSVVTDDVSLNFASVGGAGTTTITPIEPSSSGTAPVGTTLVGPAYNVTSTATTSGATSLCVRVPYITDATAFAKLKLLHLEGSLVDRTSSRSFAAKSICGSLPSLTKVVVALATNTGTVAVNDGDNQSVPIGTAFQPLKAIVTGAGATPLSGVAVTFSAVGGAGGASGTFASSSTVLTDVNGIATASTLTANGIAGNFTVTASAAGIPSLATFNLTSTSSALAAPTNVVATALTTTSVSITWNASPGATSYEVVRVGAGGVTTSAGTTSSTVLTDTTAAVDTAYVYKVRATAPSVSPFSTSDLATTTIFTDSSLGGVAVKATHFTEARTAVNAVRALAGLGAFAFTDPALSNALAIKAVHLTELRSALDAARAALLLPAITYGTPTITPGGTIISAVNLYELREGVK
jgi:hypothetical protein